MKNSIGRALVIAMLATSISAFAVSDKSKESKDTKTESANSAAAMVGCPADPTSAAQSDDGKSDLQRQQLIKEQEKQWLQEVDYAR